MPVVRVASSPLARRLFSTPPGAGEELTTLTTMYGQKDAAFHFIHTVVPARYSTCSSEGGACWDIGVPHFSPIRCTFNILSRSGGG